VDELPAIGIAISFIVGQDHRVQVAPSINTHRAAAIP
jgi:hypothetical protein